MSDEKNWDSLRDKIIGLGEQSARKSYFPELQKKIKELEEREINLLTLFNNNFDAIIIIDEKGRLFDVNDSMLTMYEMPDKQSALKHPFTCYSQNSNDYELQQKIAKTLEGAPQLFEWKAFKPITKKLFDTEIALRAAQWYGQRAIIATIRDISFRKQSEIELLERERMLSQHNEELHALNEELAESNHQIIDINDKLKKANQKAVESDRLKSAFLANMSHEIRTPMNGIIGFASLLSIPDNNKEAVDEYVSIINSCSQQLLTIIDDIIDISKIEAGQMKLAPIPTNINNLINELCSLYQSKCQASVELKVELPLTDDVCTMMVDPDRLRQVLINLINNAIKFTSSGKIVMGYHVTPADIEFFVSDTGIGIDPQFQRKIFKRFHQIETGKSKNYGGTGLGLAISKALVTLMGGGISVKSHLNQGSTFYFVLPLNVNK